MSVTVPTPPAPVRAREVVSAAAEVMSVSPSTSVLTVVPPEEAALAEAEVPPLWQTVLPVAEASAVAEAPPLQEAKAQLLVTALGLQAGAAVL